MTGNVATIEPVKVFVGDNKPQDGEDTETPKVIITSLPDNGRLFADGVEITQADIEASEQFDAESITFQSYGFLLGSNDTDRLTDGSFGENYGDFLSLQTGATTFIDIASETSNFAIGDNFTINATTKSGLAIGDDDSISGDEVLVIQLQHNQTQRITIGLDDIEVEDGANLNFIVYGMDNFSHEGVLELNHIENGSTEISITLPTEMGLMDIHTMRLSVDDSSNSDFSFNVRYMKFEGNVENEFTYKPVDSEGLVGEEYLVAINGDGDPLSDNTSGNMDPVNDNSMATLQIAEILNFEDDDLDLLFEHLPQDAEEAPSATNPVIDTHAATSGIQVDVVDHLFNDLNNVNYDT